MVNAGAKTANIVGDRFPTLSQDLLTFPVREGEDAWTAEEVFPIVEALITEQSGLEDELAAADSELAEFLRNSGDGSGDDQADYGSSALEREQKLTLVNNTRDLLEQNKRALARLEAGTFGTCESCGLAVGKARQEAFPRATLCVECKQKESRR